jgi:hypothetical protein
VLEARGAVEDGVGVLGVDGEDDGIGHWRSSEGDRQGYRRVLASRSSLVTPA